MKSLLWLATFCLLAVASASAFPRAARYTAYKLFELVIQADVIVAGEIVSVTPRADEPARTFELRIESVIAGDAPTSSIRVECFRDWTCASRWTPYATGQRVLVWLRRPSSVDGAFQILGAGDEGEMPLEADGVRLHGSAVPLKELGEAVRGFRDHYKWSVAGSAGRGWIGGREDRDFLRFASSSTLTRQLHRQAISSSMWRGADGSSEPRTFPTATANVSLRSVPGSPIRGPSAMAAIGDIDGNGVEDFAVGSREEVQFIYCGALFVLLMEADGRVRTSVRITEGESGFPAKMHGRVDFGASVAALGDVNGDGVPDVAVGAPAWNGVAESSGAVWVLLLARDGTVSRGIELSTSSALTALGVKPGSRIGRSLACVGDLDEDGSPEIAIGQEPGFATAESGGPAVFVVSLDRDGAVRWARRIDAREHSVRGRHELGAAIAALGDVDGDRVPDLAITDADDGSVQSLGAVWIEFMQRDGGVRARQKIAEGQAGFDVWLHEEARFGSALCSPGDLDGDGVPELLVASRDRLWGLALDRGGRVRAHIALRHAEKSPFGWVALATASRTSAPASNSVACVDRFGGLVLVDARALAPARSK